MTQRVRLILTLHDHQPIGNFDGVFEASYRESYLPFLEVLERYADVPVVLHTSGSLLEWLVDRHPEYIDRVRALVERDQVEIIGGPFFEPILASIPSRDRVGQIKAYTAYLEQLFGRRVRGMWVPERVWEQSFASDIVEAGIEYTLLDDYHFKNAGLRDDELYGYYLTEDEGRLLKVFPVCERLRYTIPFAEPHETINHLRWIAEKQPGAVVAFGDDGEKFGSWPDTHKHVYENGWIHRFFEALRHNSDWLETATLGSVVDNVPPTGKVYIPDASYREMTEWALPTARQREYFDIAADLKHHPKWSHLQPYIRGGFWRNFKTKYPETNEMYARMLEVSHKLAAAEISPHRPEETNGSGSFSAEEAETRRSDLLRKARLELYRGQCNCGYWHGAFGGLYLPHLRNAVYQHLIAAENLLDRAEGRTSPWVEAEAADFNLDARKEVRLASDRVVAYLSPARGGHLYELDIRGIRHNLLATLDRRPEPYHAAIIEAAKQFGDQGLPPQHNGVRYKSSDLHKHIHYDAWPRKSLVDHFLTPGLPRLAFQKGEGEQGDFATGVYESVIKRSARHVQVEMTRRGRVGSHEIVVRKTIGLDRGSASQELEIHYELDNLPAGVPFHFGIEFGMAGVAAGASDRFYYNADGRSLGQLQTELDLPPTTRLGLVDEWLGLDVSLDVSRPAAFWTFPIQTISQSEGGYEGVHQSCVVMPHWQVLGGAEGRWEVTLRLTLDTSAAQARSLREPVAVG
jgi:4-alpha-glucanotransferase